MGAQYSIWLSDPRGRRLALLDTFVQLEYALAVNAVGALTLTLPAARIDPALVKLDGRIEVWRSVDGGPEYLDGDTVWFIRKITRRFQGGERLLALTAVSAVELLARRIVAYAAGTSQTEKEGPADDVMKQVVRENLGSSATDTARDLSSYLSVQPNLGLGPTIKKAFARRNVLQVLQEIAQASVEAGTPTFFDVVAPTPATLQFRTYTDLRGADHSLSGASPVVLSPEFGNLENASLTDDRSREATYIYAAGAGTEDARAVATAEDTVRSGASPFNRREILVNASQTSDATALQAEANAALRNNRPRRTLTGTIVETDATQYGLHWRWGDRVAWEFEGESGTATIDAVRVRVERGAETVTAELKSET